MERQRERDDYRKEPGTMATPREQEDEHLFHVRQFKNIRPGLDVMSAYTMTPKRSLSRYEMTGHKKTERVFRTEDGALLAPGAPVILGEDGKVRHARPWNLPGKFQGFVLAPREDSRVHVLTTGCFVLVVRGGETARPGARGSFPA